MFDVMRLILNFNHGVKNGAFCSEVDFALRCSEDQAERFDRRFMRVLNQEKPLEFWKKHSLEK